MLMLILMMPLHPADTPADTSYNTVKLLAETTSPPDGGNHCQRSRMIVLLDTFGWKDHELWYFWLYFLPRAYI